MIGALTIDESMVLLDPAEGGPLDAVPGHRRRVAGAESNVVIALVRLGRHGLPISFDSSLWPRLRGASEVQLPAGETDRRLLCELRRRSGCGSAGGNRRRRDHPRPGRGEGALAARVRIQELEGEQ